MFQFSIEYFNFLIAIMSCGRELSVSCKVFTKNFFATKFISHFLAQYFWQKLETNLQFNSICHPQTDEQTKVGNRSLDNILWSQQRTEACYLWPTDWPPKILKMLFFFSLKNNQKVIFMVWPSKILWVHFFERKMCKNFQTFKRFQPLWKQMQYYKWE